MNLKNSNAIFSYLGYGLALAGIKLIYSFFGFAIILDTIVFMIAGFVIARRKTEKVWVLTLGLALPAFLMCLLFLLRIGYQSISEGVGIFYAVSLLVIPVATAVGVLLGSYFKQKE